jgi:amino acid adenylation domain-containing protein
MQEGMLFHTLYAPHSGVYVVQLCYVLGGGLNVEAFKQAWREVMSRHKVLSTFFLWERDKPLQVVRQQVELPWAEHDWRALSPDERQERLKSLLEADRKQGFDPGKAPLMRLTLVRLTDSSYYFIWSFHHMLLDGWSMPLLQKELLLFYDAYCEGRKLRLEPPRPYKEYITWLQHQDMSHAETFWRETLNGFTAPTPLGVDRPTHQESVSDYRYEKQEQRLSTALTASLRNLARQHQLTLNTLIEGAWILLLSRYSGEEDVVVGAISSGRPAGLDGVESMVGMFINTLPVRAQTPPDAPLIPWLRSLQDSRVESRKYEYSPLVQIHGWSTVPRTTPLFESLFVFENYPLLELLRERQWGLEAHDVLSFEQTNYPLTVVASPGPELMLRLCYEYPRLDDATVTRMLNHFAALLEEMVARPEARLSELSILPDAERRQLLREWNDSAVEFPDDFCVHQLFEQQTARAPEAIAITSTEHQLTYAELNRRANRLARHLQRLGVAPESRVGVCLERTPEMVVAILAVLKAGGAFVPLDPSYPRERLAFMLDDAGVEVLLSHTSQAERLPDYDGRLVLLDAERETVARESAADAACGATPDNVAYVIYTSGSTGRPKGVMLSHRGGCNLYRAVTPPFAFDIAPGHRVLQFASLSFDAAVCELFMTLLSGATLCLASRESLLPGSPLVELLREQAITNAIFPPTALAALPDDVELPQLRTIIVAGEACPPEVLARWSRGRRFVNGYGPSETTVCATLAECHDEYRDDQQPPPIGRPVANARVYLLDKYLRPVPVGVQGELHIGGLGVGRGYLHRPGLTAERFIPDPFGEEPGARLYKSGDRARYRPDGEIEFLGRIDHQVKIRGFRIEPGEVETLLKEHTAIRDAAVVVREEDGEKQLVAYMVAADTEREPPTDELRRFLGRRLPEYMIPTAFVALKALPLTPAGKLDRAALPAPEGARPELETPFVAPRTDAEQKIAGIWRQVLGVEMVGADDNFFDLGGHSLLVVRAHAKLREAFGHDISLVDVFKYPTVRSLAQYFDESGTRDDAPLVDVKLEKLSEGKDRLHRLRQSQKAARRGSGVSE